MTGPEVSVPAWCSVGAYAVVTDGTYDATGMWRAVQITEIKAGWIHVRATRPHTGSFTFEAQVDGRRPWNSKSKLELAPAEGPQVAGQRAARDEAKYGPGWREWVLGDEGRWYPERKHRVAGPGRPAIGPKVEVRFPLSLLTRLDEHRGDVSRPSVIRNLVEQALDAPVAERMWTVERGSYEDHVVMCLCATEEQAEATAAVYNSYAGDHPDKAVVGWLPVVGQAEEIRDLFPE